MCAMSMTVCTQVRAIDNMEKDDSNRKLVVVYKSSCKSQTILYTQVPPLTTSAYSTHLTANSPHITLTHSLNFFSQN